MEQSTLKSSRKINSFQHKIKDEFFKDFQSLDDSPTYIIRNLKAANKHGLK